ncbi:hypothetical protein [Streptomyces sp. NPDC088707]|uniref:hypothetical protein n=1 Tax=Streptomyces sp. NPDC088707 TaxID=3365871 RepID=UPI0038117FD9
MGQFRCPAPAPQPSAPTPRARTPALRAHAPRPADVFVVAAAALVLRRPARLQVRTVLALAWTGSGAVGCWGAYMSLVALMPETDPGKQVTALAQLTYAGEMITGFLLAACLAAVLRRRSAEA